MDVGLAEHLSAGVAQIVESRLWNRRGLANGIPRLAQKVRRSQNVAALGWAVPQALPSCKRLPVVQLPDGTQGFIAAICERLFERASYSLELGLNAAAVGSSLGLKLLVMLYRCLTALGL